MIDFIDKTSEQGGTPINRQKMMGIQGFSNKTTTFPSDKIIEERDLDNNTLYRIEIIDEKTIRESFYGEKTIVKTTTLNTDGSIMEVVS